VVLNAAADSSAYKNIIFFFTRLILESMENQQNSPGAENPEEFMQLELSKPKLVAAGLPAIMSSAKHVFNEMNLARGLKALAALNQKDGFDCPGCAWPDPDGNRSSIAEYCENGAKAVSEEATTKKLTAKFFVKNSAIPQEKGLIDWFEYRA